MRRYKQFHVSPELIAQLGTGSYTVVANETPDDAKLVGAAYDPDRRLFVLTLEHESFGDVKLGLTIPEVDPPCVRHDESLWRTIHVLGWSLWIGPDEKHGWAGQLKRVQDNAHYWIYADSPVEVIDKAFDFIKLE